MAKFFSPSTQGFYDSSINLVRPEDAVLITTDTYNTLLTAQSSGLGIAVDGQGLPVISPRTLDQVKAGKLAELTAACAATVVGGYPSGALGTVHTYPNKPTDQINLAGSIIASLLPNLASGWTTPFWCVDSAGTWAMLNHTMTQIQQVGLDAKAFVIAQQQKLVTLNTQVGTASTITAAQAVVWG